MDEIDEILIIINNFQKYLYIPQIQKLELKAFKPLTGYFSLFSVTVSQNIQNYIK